MLHKQDGGALLVDYFDNVENCLHQDRGQAHRRFVHQEQARVSHEGSTCGEHLLFSAGERPRHLVFALFQTGKDGEDPFQVFLHGGAVAAGVGAQVQVLGHRQAGENAASFRDHRNAFRDNFMRLERVDIFTFEQDLALARFLDATNGTQGGGFAGSVGADQGDDFSFFHRQRDAFERMNVAVIGVNVLNFEQWHNKIPRDQAGSGVGLSSPEAAPLPR